MSRKFAMSDLTADQLNSIVEKLGGHAGALQFLRTGTLPEPSKVVPGVPFMAPYDERSLAKNLFTNELLKTTDLISVNSRERFRMRLGNRTVQDLTSMTAEEVAKLVKYKAHLQAVFKVLEFYGLSLRR